MTMKPASGCAMGIGTAIAKVDTRYSFTAQFLCSSAIFARRCAEIERDNLIDRIEAIRTEHRGLVTAAIMQCAAAIEAESAEITLHGPGGHLGTNGIDATAHSFLAPLAEFIDAQSPLERYRLILHLLKKPPLPKDEQPWRDMDILFKVRNELIHYKSKLGEEMDRQKLFKALRGLDLLKPPFIPSSGMNFFPHQFLSAACAAWSVHTAVEFINAVYRRLEIDGPLKPYMAQLNGLHEPRKIT
jgi:hypothetical protein